MARSSSKNPNDTHPATQKPEWLSGEARPEDWQPLSEIATVTHQPASLHVTPGPNDLVWGTGILTDEAIAAYSQPGNKHPMICPFTDTQVRKITDVVSGKEMSVISYGLSSYGYDVRIAEQFQVFTPALDPDCLAVDPKNFSSRFMREVRVDPHQPLIIPPNAYALGHSVEKFEMPADVTGVCVGKSTYARCGVIVNVTPLEAGWRGYVTIEISNATSLPVKVYAGEGIMQVLFYRGAPCRVSYATRPGGGGKYQDQGAEITNARL